MATKAEILQIQLNTRGVDAPVAVKIQAQREEPVADLDTHEDSPSVSDPRD